MGPGSGQDLAPGLPCPPDPHCGPGRRPGEWVVGVPSLNMGKYPTSVEGRLGLGGWMNRRPLGRYIVPPAVREQRTDKSTVYGRMRSSGRANLPTSGRGFVIPSGKYSLDGEAQSLKRIVKCHELAAKKSASLQQAASIHRPFVHCRKTKNFCSSPIKAHNLPALPDRLG